MKENNDPIEIIIKPPKGLPELNFREYYKFRHLMWNMIKKNVRLQFEDKVLGFVWAFARPLTMLLVFSLLRRLSRAQLYNTIPYSVYLYAGVIFWFYFVESVTAAQRSISSDAGIIKRIYYPRLITPIVPVVARMYGLMLSFIPLVILMFVDHVPPGWRLLLLPIVLLQGIVLSLGIGTMFAALSLKKKDYETFLNLLLYVGLFISPVIYSPEMISKGALLFYYMNPVAGMLLAFRSCWFADFPFPLWQFLYSCAASIFYLLVGTTMFRRAEMYFSDKL
ncbi:MAG TPA: ABC transporter permease [Candidatus Deferrimicrobium sp.]|nr:ABC transporter permease [Candidatus Deferrimicrobium sp.]